MVNPVASTLDSRNRRVVKRLGATVILWIRCPRFGPVYQQRRAINSRINFPRFFGRQTDWRKGPYIVIELPTVTAVFILIAAMDGEMSGLVLTQVRVFRLHPLERIF